MAPSLGTLIKFVRRLLYLKFKSSSLTNGHHCLHFIKKVSKVLRIWHEVSTVSVSNTQVGTQSKILLSYWQMVGMPESQGDKQLFLWKQQESFSYSGSKHSPNEMHASRYASNGCVSSNSYIPITVSKVVGRGMGRVIEAG